MRLVLHRRFTPMLTPSWSITSASPAGSWRTISTSSYAASCSTQPSGPSRSPSASATFAASTSIVSLTIFFSALPAMRCGFSSFVIIGGIRHWAFIDDEPSTNHALQRLSAVRSSVAGIPEPTVRSTRAAEAVAELGSLGVARASGE